MPADVPAERLSVSAGTVVAMLVGGATILVPIVIWLASLCERVTASETTIDKQIVRTDVMADRLKAQEQAAAVQEIRWATVEALLHKIDAKVTAHLEKSP
jgi:ABC-type proline/glycine betaine transport system substrate-binding protein